ncbi:MAG TPA: 3-deoxy-7-phosphoheptulonate synthase [Chloroflexota bacterium]
MIISMSPTATEDDIKGVLKRLEDDGWGGEVIQGSQRVVIGVVGTGFPPDYLDHVEVLPGVDNVARITKPYKLASRDFRPVDTVVDVRGVKIGGGEFMVMAGPCACESRDQVLETADAAANCGAHVFRAGAYKPRTSPYSFQGLGEEGLQYMAEARDRTGLPLITEVMDTADIDLVDHYTDIFQIGTRNMQNFSLLRAVGQKGKPVMLKRGMSATVEDWLMASEYILAEGNRQVILCERGIRTFETAVRNTLDIAIVPLVKRLSHLPVIVDPSHGTGKWYLVKPAALAAAAVGADGIMIEIHPDPDKAWSDGPQALTPANFADLMQSLEGVVAATGRKMAHLPVASAV